MSTFIERSWATFSVHRTPGELSKGSHRGGEGAQKEVRKADGKILREPRAIPRTVDQKTGHRLAGGKESCQSHCLILNMRQNLIHLLTEN